VSSDRLYFRQLLAGTDFANEDPVARQMVNLVYLIGDRSSGEAVAVDPAYDPGEILAILAADGMRLTGVLATHHHPDHVGGDLFGHAIVGIAALLELVEVPIHANQHEIGWIGDTTGVGRDTMVAHQGGDVLQVGGIGIRLLHTPGHTPGSQCFLVEGCLVAGDTLFLRGCGRTDFPGGDPAAMYDSLVNRLAKLPDDTILYPGHLYSPEGSGTLGDTKRKNPVLAPRGAEAWLALFAS
jgi:glyoxylase-like metal-dependent hydrolase (beta-lactamase superfamily II)